MLLYTKKFFFNLSLCSLFFFSLQSNIKTNYLIVASFHWDRFRPRILIDVSKIDMSTTVLGFKISMPIMIAPTAMQKMAHPEGKKLPNSIVNSIFLVSYAVSVYIGLENCQMLWIVGTCWKLICQV